MGQQTALKIDATLKVQNNFFMHFQNSIILGVFFGKIFYLQRIQSIMIYGILYCLHKIEEERVK